MSGFDVNAYYAEQDEWMNIPDETVDEFLKRVSALPRGQGSSPYVSSSRMPQANQSITEDNPQSTASLPTAEAHPCASVERSQIGVNETTADFGRTLKRKAIDQELEVEHNRKKLADQKNSQEINEQQPLIIPSTSLSPTHVNIADSEVPLSDPERSAELEEIDSFTVELTASQIPRKRKTPPRHVRQSPRKEKLQGGNMAPQIPPAVATADDSPILSFARTTEHPPKKPLNLRKGDVASVPPLDLRPLRQPTVLIGSKKSKHDVHSTAYESPIEDASVSAASPAVPKKKKRLESESSEMYLEMKERIAKHSLSKKQRDKVVKLKAKPVLQDPTIAESAHHIDESSVIYISSSPSSRASSHGPTEVSASKKKQGVKEKPSKPAVEKRKPKGKKEKPQPMTPAEYARSLQPKPGNEVSAGSSTSGPLLPRRKGSGSKVLAGKNIFYIGGDMRHASEATRRKMDIIVRNGGNLMPEYDPNVTTHIVVDAHLGPTLRDLGVRGLKQVPNHIPTVKWTWVVAALDMQSYSQDEIDRKLSDYSRYAAFAERINAGCELPVTKSVPSFKNKGKERAVGERPSEGSVSRNIASTVQPDLTTVSENSGEPGPSSSVPLIGAPLSPPTSPVRPTGHTKAHEPANSRTPGKVNQKDNSQVSDPLAEFYQQAKFKRQNDDGWSSFGELDAEWVDPDEQGTDDDEGVSDSVLQMPKQKRGWTCDKKEPQILAANPNQDIIDKLTELMQLHKAKLGEDDRWRAFSYSKAIRALRSYPRRIKNYEEARTLKGVGEKTARKIQEILETGDLRRIKYETTKDVEVTRLFQGIYGVGQSIAFQWYSAGCRTLQDLKSGKGGVKLTSVQEIGLRFYDDINDRMPRAEAKEIFDVIKPIALSIDPKLFIEIMGSYRRGKADCGDIDVLITRPTDDGKTHMGVMSRLMQKLHAAHILTEDLALPDDPYDLEATYRGLCRLPDVPRSRRRRIDILSVPWTSRGAALLYYTGDDIFNRAIRMKANALGYSLNQRGLFGGVVRDPRDRRIKLNTGTIVASETEEEIFKILGVPWQEPHERVRG